MLKEWLHNNCIVLNFSDCRYKRAAEAGSRGHSQEGDTTTRVLQAGSIPRGETILTITTAPYYYDTTEYKY